MRSEGSGTSTGFETFQVILSYTMGTNFHQAWTSLSRIPQVGLSGVTPALWIPSLELRDLFHEICFVRKSGFLLYNFPIKHVS